MSDSTTEAAPVECTFCRDKLPHPQFAQFMCSKRTLDSGPSAWDFTRQPVWNLACHNRERRMRFGPKHTKAGAPHHQNKLIVGPFKANACAFVQVNRLKLRKFTNRAARGIALAARWHEIDPAQGGVPVRVSCKGKDENDPEFKAAQAELEALWAQCPPDEKQMKQLEKAAREALDETSSRRV